MAKKKTKNPLLNNNGLSLSYKNWLQKASNSKEGIETTHYSANKRQFLKIIKPLNKKYT
jgi:hypothetical protein